MERALPSARHALWRDCPFHAGSPRQVSDQRRRDVLYDDRGPDLEWLHSARADFLQSPRASIRVSTALAVRRRGAVGAGRPDDRSHPLAAGIRFHAVDPGILLDGGTDARLAHDGGAEHSGLCSDAALLFLVRDGWRFEPRPG